MTDDDGKISYDLYKRGVMCLGSGMIFFAPDPEVPGRGVCPRCSCSIGVVQGHHLDDHQVLPEMVRYDPLADAPPVQE